MNHAHLAGRYSHGAGNSFPGEHFPPVGLHRGGLFGEALVAYGDYSREPALDAVAAGNDLMALGAMDVLAEAGLAVPGDVAVAGFDDIDLSASSIPALTTVRQPFERISREMVRLLLEVIAGQRPAVITMPTELMVRQST
ncbi:substrate-binding domain-containing protein [Specibacter sp. NPDC057265]|uniref:substrate-binding domain-containing protein n=1 Tax=Specibacter sp. NPDC057265 TaxID=3346075 RepID=UPI00364185C9